MRNLQLALCPPRSVKERMCCKMCYERSSDGRSQLLAEEAAPVVRGRVLGPKSDVVCPTGNEHGAAVGAKESCC